MAVTGQDLPGLRKQTNSARHGNAALSRVWDGVRREAKRVVTPIQRLLAQTVFSSLTWRIVTLNLVALPVLVTGIVYLIQ